MRLAKKLSAAPLVPHARSPYQVRCAPTAGYGGCGPGGVQQFFPLPWCPVHRDAEMALPGVVTLRIPDDEPPAA